MKNKKVEKKNNSIAINARTLKLLYNIIDNTPRKKGQH